jgi:hypothetical protein
MANNTTLDPGTGGDTIATDDVAGVKYQRIKIIDGAEDSTAAIGGDAANGLDVDVTRSALPTGASTAAKQPALGTAGSASRMSSRCRASRAAPSSRSRTARSLTVDNAGTFAVQDSQKVADNAGFTDGTTPVNPAGFIFDEVAGTALTENDARRRAWIQSAPRCS